MVRKISIEEWEKTRKGEDVRTTPAQVEDVSRKKRYDRPGKKDQSFDYSNLLDLENFDPDSIDWKAYFPKLYKFIIRGALIGLSIAIAFQWSYFSMMFWGGIFGTVFGLIKLGAFKGKSQ